MAAIKSPNCSVVSGLVVFSAWRRARGGIGLRGTPVTKERLGSDAQRYSELMAAIRRLNVRGFMRPASTWSRSWDTQSWQKAGLISRRCRCGWWRSRQRVNSRISKR